MQPALRFLFAEIIAHRAAAAADGRILLEFPHRIGSASPYRVRTAQADIAAEIAYRSAAVASAAGFGLRHFHTAADIAVKPHLCRRHCGHQQQHRRQPSRCPVHDHTLTLVTE